MIMKDPSVPFTNLYLNGEERPAACDKFFEVRNPFTGAVIGHAAAANSADCLEAIETAAEALKTWEHSPLFQRRNVFLKAAELLQTKRYQERILQTIHEETAAANIVPMFDMMASVEVLKDIAGLTSQLKGETYPSCLPGGHVLMQRRAIGVMLVLTFISEFTEQLTDLMLDHVSISLLP